VYTANGVKAPRCLKCDGAAGAGSRKAATTDNRDGTYTVTLPHFSPLTDQSHTAEGMQPEDIQGESKVAECVHADSLRILRLGSQIG
jgi:hypothetical protein